MPRLPRVAPAGIAVHIIQRGNNRQACFVSDEDHWSYTGWLKNYSAKYRVDIHAWVMMTNHVHLLCTPHDEAGISKMMQAIGRRYVQYFNREYRRSGTLWEGRFKSCLVESEDYLLELYRYIEINPVRANMVKDPGEYRWSSYQVNGLGKASDLCTPHREYLSLGRDPIDRQSNYRELFVHQIEGELLKEIRDSTHKGMAVGSERFKEEIEFLTGRRLKSKKRGRPVGWRKEKD
ncbi:MAG: transposase [Thermodesulfobacteriota bacterium]|nr:transposase [Thermodesulfobacteriota bacterium]